MIAPESIPIAHAAAVDDYLGTGKGSVLHTLLTTGSIGNAHPDEILASPHIALVPYDRGHCYHWIVVDLLGRNPTVKQAIADGMARAAAHRRGLLITSSDALLAPEHVDVVRQGELEGSAVESMFGFVQYVRTVLRSLPPCRLLLAADSDLLLLDDALARHNLAACTSLPTRPQTGANTASRRRVRQRVDRFAEVLTWLRDRDRLEPEEVVDGLTRDREDPAGRHTQARTFLRYGPHHDEPSPASPASAAPPVLPCGAAAVAAHLTPGEVTPDSKLPPTLGEVREEALSDRLPKTARRRVLFACVHLLGDSLNATPVLRDHRERHPDDHITLLVPDQSASDVFRLSPHIDRLARVSVGFEQLVYGSSTDWVASLPYILGFDSVTTLDVQLAAGFGEGQVHMAECYAALAAREIANRRPQLDVAGAKRFCPAFANASQYIVISRHSVSGIAGASDPMTKRWPESRWKTLCRRLRDELGLTIYSIGTPADQRLESRDVVDLHDMTILEVAGLLANARSMITVDNGVYHLGQAVGTPVVHLVPNWLGSHWTASSPEVPHIDLVAELPRLGVGRVLEAARRLEAELPRRPPHAHALPAEEDAP